MRPALVFIGFMGAGKSAALAAARKAGLETTEIDDLMERELGMPIREAFERDGEDAFREREAEVVGSLLEGADGGAIALGGGSVLSARVRAALDRHLVAWLQVDAAEAWRRIEGSDRPLATSEEDVERLLAEREPFYEELADVAVPAGGRDQIEPVVKSLILLAQAPPGTRMLWAQSKLGGYPVFVGSGLLRSGFFPFQGRAYCVTDTTVGPLYAERLAVAETYEIAPGEKQKSLETAELIWKRLMDFGLTRHDSLVALGGGVIGDLVGFCAATYQRGIPVVQVPTTLVAQVDSAYGGKTGVDLYGTKNYVGAYHMPAAVIADTETLEALPREILAAGFVEALKTGLLAGGDLWERVRTIEVLDPRELDDVVFACARYKCEVVAGDERDQGARQTLNLGHTVGHAIEAAAGLERYSHGEAVGLGLLAALRLSGASDLRDECEKILSRHGLPVCLDPAVGLEEILAVLRRDKKQTAEGVGFVLLPEPGRWLMEQIIEPARVEAAVLELYE